MDELLDLDGIPQEELDGFLAFRQKVAGTNISGQTLLATDYLNHFNEIIMLLDMVADMPDILEDCRQWQPKSYVDHFRDSAFSDRDLAVEAYGYVPTKVRKPFEDIIAQMNQIVLTKLEHLDHLVAEGADPEVLRIESGDASRALQLLMDRASAVIHGSSRAMAQAEIDSVLE